MFLAGMVVICIVITYVLDMAKGFHVPPPGSTYWGSFLFLNDFMDWLANSKRNMSSIILDMVIICSVQLRTRNIEYICLSG